MYAGLGSFDALAVQRSEQLYMGQPASGFAVCTDVQSHLTTWKICGEVISIVELLQVFKANVNWICQVWLFKYIYPVSSLVKNVKVSS